MVAGSRAVRGRAREGLRRAGHSPQAASGYILRNRSALLVAHDSRFSPAPPWRLPFFQRGPEMKCAKSSANSVEHVGGGRQADLVCAPSAGARPELSGGRADPFRNF